MTTDRVAAPSRQADRSGQCLLAVEDLEKHFGPTHALRGVTMAIEPGQIHALLGENGSGKSTAAKIIAGVVRPDRGRVSWAGRPVSFRGPADARIAGIATVFQETLVVEELSILDNLLLGVDGTFRQGLDRRTIEMRARSALEPFALDGLPLDTPVWELSLALRQAVTIARATMLPWQLLILDESASAFDAQQRQRLYDWLEHRPADTSVLYVSHRMSEIRRLADQVTVLVDGRVAGSVDSRRTAPADLVRMMSRSPANRHRATALKGRHPAAIGPIETPAAQLPVLRMHGIALTDGAPPFDLELCRGDICGVLGLEGHGQAELVEIVAGLRRPASGVVEVANGLAWQEVTSARGAYRSGIGYVPRERVREGIFAELSVAVNLMAPHIGRHARFGLISRRALRREAHRVAERARVKGGSLDGEIRRLSGGNQQKVLVGRGVAAEPTVLVLHDPMRGIDAPSKQELTFIITEIALDGAAVLWLSSEIEELLEICTKIVVIRNQTVGAILDPGVADEPDVLAEMFGVDRTEAGAT